ncbi:MAG TPA: hypothetical protein VN277_08190 [Acidiferrobacterales bacterium]|nr:hypothetical protein [Acidiferrobacterales bacterium]
MAVLTFSTAPCSVGTLYQSLLDWRTPRQAFVAACAWMFSASWSYDLYLLLRDGTYPVTWAANIAASSVLYVCAGLVWSLEFQPRRGVIFAFQREDWPLHPHRTRFVKLWWVAAPFIVIVAVALLSFLAPS